MRTVVLPQEFLIETNIENAIDRITKNRMFALVEFFTGSRPDDAINPAKNAEYAIWIQIREQEADDKLVSKWLFVAAKSNSRDSDSHTSLFESCLLRNYKEREDCRLSFPTFSQLKEIVQGSILSCSILGSTKIQPQELFLHNVLQMPNDKAFTNDRSSITIFLEKAVENREDHPFVFEVYSSKRRQYEYLDIRDFEVCEVFSKMLERFSKDITYKDTFYIEYTQIFIDHVEVHMALEFYSNHLWDRDPINVIDIGFGAILSLRMPTYLSLCLEHPENITREKSTGDPYLISQIEMDNQVEDLWFTLYPNGHRIPQDDCSKDRILEIPSQLENWLSLHVGEIEMS